MPSVGSFACLGETNFEHAPQKKCHDMHEMACSFKVVKCLASAVAKERVLDKTSEDNHLLMRMKGSH